MSKKKVDELFGEETSNGVEKTCNIESEKVQYYKTKIIDEINNLANNLDSIYEAEKNNPLLLSVYVKNIIRPNENCFDDNFFTNAFVSNITEYKERLEEINRLLKGNKKLENIKIKEDNSDIEFTIKE